MYQIVEVERYSVYNIQELIENQSPQHSLNPASGNFSQSKARSNCKYLLYTPLMVVKILDHSLTWGASSNWQIIQHCNITTTQLVTVISSIAYNGLVRAEILKVLWYHSINCTAISDSRYISICHCLRQTEHRMRIQAWQMQRQSIVKLRQSTTACILTGSTTFSAILDLTVTIHTFIFPVRKHLLNV